ncbi:MAG: TonB-dependent receptor plug domain-containing protein [Bacteroidota bacterium]
MNGSYLYKTLIIYFLASFFLNASLLAQNSKDTLKLPTVTIIDTKINYFQGLKISEIDTVIISQQINASLADLLSNYTPVFIKTYGQGSLATASFRGCNASHTQVLWNDVAINSPMIGQMDFSMIPVFFMDDLKLIYGGSSLSNNSGGLGGSINIANKPDKEKLKIQYTQQIGSFSTYGSFLKLGIGNKNLKSTTRLMFLTSENDFSFKNNAVASVDFPLEIRKDAGFKQYGVLQELYFQPGFRDQISFKLWLQKNDRNIPQPLIVSTFSENEKQKNSFYRGIINWKHYQGKAKLETNLSYLHDFLNYTNKIAFINSDNTVNAICGKLKYNYEFSPIIMLNLGSSYEFNSVNSNNYSGLKEQKLFATFAGFSSALSKRLFANFIVRQEVNNSKTLPLLPSLGIDYKFLKTYNLLLKAHVSKNYHLPSLNDLYWFPGGNPDLLPEDGFSAESGCSYETDATKTLSIYSEASYFYTNISNWILWQPDAIFRYWTPINLKEVTSSGVELTTRIKFEMKKCMLKLNAYYTFTSAKNLKSIHLNDQTVDKQLIYTPLHSINFDFRAEWKNYFANYTLHYTGKRFTNTSNTRYMPDYMISDVTIGSILYLKNMKSICFQINVNNILDKDYQAIAWQPMPGRNMEILVKFDLSKK